MTVSKKGRHKLIVGDCLYLWWVCQKDPEYNSASTLALTVASEDGRFCVRFYLGQPAERRFLIVLGREFVGVPEAGGPWIRVQCPEWQTGPNVTPSAVRRLVEWCASGREHVRVNYLGLPAEMGSPRQGGAADAGVATAYGDSAGRARDKL